MDFLDPAKKRKHGIRLFVGYILVGIAIALAAVIMVWLAYGYSFDRKTGEVVQNGIVFVSSDPSGAGLYFNGEQYKDNTDARVVLPSKDYHLEIRKSGYRTWQRDFFLAGGTIERFVYPRLFPEVLKTSDLATYKAAPAMATQSPNRRWLLVQPTATKPAFELYDLEQAAPVAERLELPSGLFTKGTRKIEFVEWANDNRRVLLKHTYGKKTEYVIVDCEEPSASINVNELTEAKFSTMSLRDKKHDQWYLHNATNGRLFTASRSVPTPRSVLDNVAAYKTHGNDIILFATTSKASKGKARILIRDNDRTDLLREVTVSKQYLLDVARFDNQWYFVAGSTADGKIYVYREPFAAIRKTPRTDPVAATIMRLENAEFVSFSQNTRFVAVQARGDFAVYDAETKRAFRYKTGLPFTAGQKAVWMDGHRLTGVISGQVVVFDYDGINQQTLLKSQTGLLPYFANNYDDLYVIAPKTNSKEANLARASLIAE